MINEILDAYNHYKFLYELFGDEHYADKMFGWEAEFYKVTEWCYEVLDNKDVSGYKRIKRRSHGLTT